MRDVKLRGRTLRTDLLARKPGRMLVAAGLLATALTLGACSGAPSSSSSASKASLSDSPSAPPSSTTPAGPPVITAQPANGATSVSPAAPITLSVASGRLTSVSMTNAYGTHVTGRLLGDGSQWTATEDLGYGRTYTIDAVAANTEGKTTTSKVSFTTLNPAGTTNVTLQRMGGYALGSAQTYGVGIVPVVHFDQPVTNEAVTQKSLRITASKPVAGVWSWIDNQDVAYRPHTFWPQNTAVTLDANVYGVQTASGVYGASDESTTFTVGRQQITQAYDNAPNGIDKVEVYNAAGTLLRSMNTSMGQHSGEYVNGNWINFYTLGGTYTVLDHENPALMSSASYGLPASDPHGYGTLSVPYSTKISVDGIYLHEYNSTIYDQDNGIDASEGCLNLRTADAVWFYDNSIAGDPVIVHPAAGAPTIAPWQGGYWSIPWTTWVKNSAT